MYEIWSKIYWFFRRCKRNIELWRSYLKSVVYSETMMIKLSIWHQGPFSMSIPACLSQVNYEILTSVSTILSKSIFNLKVLKTYLSKELRFLKSAQTWLGTVSGRSNEQYNTRNRTKWLTYKIRSHILSFTFFCICCFCFGAIVMSHNKCTSLGSPAHR